MKQAKELRHQGAEDTARRATPTGRWMGLWAINFVLVLTSIELARATTGVAPFWLPVAVILAALINSPRRQWPVVVLVGDSACVAANLISGTAFPDVAVHALLNAVGPLLVAQGVHLTTGGRWHLSAKTIRSFALFAVIASALLATVGASWRLAFHGSPFAQVWPEWFISNALGFLIGTPFILSWSEPALRPAASRAVLIETAILSLLIAAVTFVAVASPLPLSFMVFPMLALVTARQGLAGATGGIIAFAAVTLGCMIAGVGPIANLDASPFVKMLLVRAYLLTGVLSTLPVAVFLALRGILHRTLDSTIQGLAMFDHAHRLIMCNRRFATIYGLSDQQIARGTPLEDFRLADGRPIFRTPSSCCSAVERSACERSQLELADGRIIETQSCMMAGQTWMTTHEDVTHKRIADRRIAHLANHDSLTDLANRAAFRNELERQIAGLGTGEMFAIHAIDLDRFKAVNDTLGHAAGDELLRQVAQRLREETRNSDLVARLGGDEFAIIQTPLVSPEDAHCLASRIVEALSWPFDIQGQQASVGASVGVSCAPEDGSSPSELLQKSDIALYRSKSEGRNRYCIYEPGMDALLQERRRLESDLRAAIQKGQFVLHYQPLFDVDTGRVAAAEALVRWQHPTRGLLAPGEFIGIAEETGLIVPIGEWVLRHACYEAASWPSDITLAVNISPVQFKSRNLVNLIMSALGSAGLPPERLEIEITESVLLEDSEELLALLNELHAAGIRIAMDDFGTGYSSLSNLRTFPFDKIKIDQSFVQDLGSNDEALAIVNATTSLSQQLGIRTTAEGVETEEQLAILRDQGCTEVQGFYLSGPLASGDLRDLLLPEAVTDRRKVARRKRA